VLKMDKTRLFAIFAVILALSTAFWAESQDSDSDVRITPGMEVEKRGDVNVLIPKGGRLIKEGKDVWVIEDADQYAARKFEEVGKRLDKIEKNQEETKKEVKALKEAIGEAKRYDTTLDKEGKR